MGELTREAPKGAAICRSCTASLKGIDSFLLSDRISGVHVRAFICDDCLVEAYLYGILTGLGTEENK